MAVDYDLICRQDDLGPLLVAAFLVKEKCRVLLLPPLSKKVPEPNFLIPVVRGYPARLLSSLMELEKPPANFLSWQSDLTSGLWPDFGSDFVNGEKGSFEVPKSILAPGSGHELEQLWQLLDGCMIKGHEIPASSLSGIGQMLWLLVRDELLRERRNCNLISWLKEAGVAGSDQQFWRSLVPLISLSRFADPPLLSFAYGVQTLLAPDVWIDIDKLKEYLFQYLLAQGADQVDEEWAPVFDGKWFIGVGNDDKVARRATLFLADSNPVSLMQEVPLPRRRRDFKRQFKLDDPGFKHQQTISSQLQRSVSQGLYHLDCRGAADFSGATLLGPAAANGQGLIEHCWQGVEIFADHPDDFAVDGLWGWRPQLPAMMGGGFLPLSGSFCRFYQIGWHNLPGFALGGLIYSAHQVAAAVTENELKR